MRFFLFALLLPSFSFAASPLEAGRKAILSLQGCYLVDFSYTETESLQPGYQRDTRVYDVNRDKSIKEWIYADDLAPGHIRIQHVLFAVGLDGKVMEETFLKHTGDDWQFDAPFRYDFVSANQWNLVRDTAGLWTQRTTNLDDGLRYSCAANWTDEAYPTWGCATYAPIPGRETRDMGRHDYQALNRFTKLVAYGNSWLTREENTKIVQQGDTKTPLAKELGKNWYVRLPDSECSAAVSFVAARKDFWQIEREAWDEVLGEGAPSFHEKPFTAGTPSRYGKISELEEKYITQNLRDGSVRAAAKAEIKSVIQEYRLP